MVNKADLYEMGITLAAAVREAIKDPLLLDEREKAISTIKDANQALGDLAEAQDAARKEAAVTRDEFKKSGDNLTGRENDLAKRSGELDAREKDLDKRDRDSDARRKIIKQEEDELSKRKSAADARDKAQDDREQKADERDASLTAREDDVSAREQKIKEAFT